jgi:hypothetical protein
MAKLVTLIYKAPNGEVWEKKGTEEYAKRLLKISNQWKVKEEKTTKKDESPK